MVHEGFPKPVQKPHPPILIGGGGKRVLGIAAREADIVRMLARGMSNAEIAEALFIETSTVKSHLGRAMAKIGTRDRLQTVVWAYRTGMARP